MTVRNGGDCFQILRGSLWCFTLSGSSPPESQQHDFLRWSLDSKKYPHTSQVCRSKINHFWIVPQTKLRALSVPRREKCTQCLRLVFSGHVSHVRGCEQLQVFCSFEHWWVIHRTSLFRAYKNYRIWSTSGALAMRSCPHNKLHQTCNELAVQMETQFLIFRFQNLSWNRTGLHWDLDLVSFVKWGTTRIFWIFWKKEWDLWTRNMCLGVPSCLILNSGFNRSRNPSRACFVVDITGILST